MTESLGTPSSIPHYATQLGSHRGVHRPLVRGGEGAPSDKVAGLEPRADPNGASAPATELIEPASSSPVQTALAEAYQAWLKREEDKSGQLNMFACHVDESAGLDEETRYSQISELPGVTFEDIFRR